MLVKIEGIHTVKRKLKNGSTRTYYYAWRGGPRMKSKPHTEAFALEHARLKEGASPVETIETLIDRFKGPDDKPNPDWLALAETTRRDHDYAFGLIKKEWPRFPIALTQQRGMKADIRKWHRSFAANPRKADKLLFSLSKLFSYAIEGELLDKNPCTGIDRLYSGSRKESVWTPEMIATFRAKAPPQMRLPFELAIQTGQRQGDILALTWKDYDGTYLQFRQSKTGARLKVKVSADLKALLEPLAKDTMRIAMNSRKRPRPWTSDGFKATWGKTLARLAIEGVTFHDLRGTFISARAAEGSSVDDIARISGHSTSEVKTVLERHYLAADQGRSDAVILRMERTQRKRKV